MRIATADEVAAALGSVTAWPPDLSPDERFVSLVDLVDSGVAARIVTRVGGGPRAVAQSSITMGIAARVWSLTVVPAGRHGVVVAPDAVCARDDEGSIVLGVRDGRGFAEVTPDDVHEVVLAVLTPLVERLPLSHRLQWGNVAAALATVPRVHGPDTAPLVADLLARPAYDGLLEVAPGGGLRRRTCCLFYLAPRGGLCGDCVLDRVPG